MTNIGINGFGRIGRLLTREIIKNPNLSIKSINHPSMKVTDLKYLLENDSAHGSFNADNNIPQLHNYELPVEIPWDSDIDFIIDTTGKFKEYKEVEKHIKRHNRHTKVIVSAPSDTLPMFIYGANHKNYNGEQFISASSCTTTCLAPIVKLLNDNYGIKHGLATTIHSVTASQSAVDKFKSGSRTGRSLFNLIPSSTGAAKSIGKIFPELDGKLDAIGIRVPVVDVSLLDLTVNLKETPKLEELIRLFRYNTNDSYKNIIDICDDGRVSSDFLGHKANAIIDVDSCKNTSDMYKIVAWYDNELGYTNQVMRLLEYVSSVKK